MAAVEVAAAQLHPATPGLGTYFAKRPFSGNLSQC